MNQCQETYRMYNVTQIKPPRYCASGTPDGPSIARATSPALTGSMRNSMKNMHAQRKARLLPAFRIAIQSITQIGRSKNPPKNDKANARWSLSGRLQITQRSGEINCRG